MAKSKASEGQTKLLIKRMEKSMKEKKAAFLKKCNADIDLKGFTINKRMALYALKLCKGNISNACKMVHITRMTFHNYINEDPAFDNMVKDVKFTLTDTVVDKLLENCEAGKETSIIYYLNCQGKHLGFGNNVNIDHTTKGDSLNKALSNMTDAELEQKLKELTAKMK